MKILKYGYGALSLVATITLGISLFFDVNPIYQVGLLAQSVGFAWLCGVYFCADSDGD